MRILAFSTLALGFGLTFVPLSGCSNSSDDCTATASCVTTAGSSTAGSAGKSSTAGSGNDAGAPAGGAASTGGSSNTSGTSGTLGVGGEGGAGSSACTGDVADDAACWTTNELGVFVSSEAGDDAAGDGTRAAPFKTIGKGVTSAAGKNVYVCVGAADYSEKLSLDAATDGVRLYGGFECGNWTYATTRSAQVVSPSNIALRIDGLKKGAYIENVRFQAADGAGLDASSYGAFVTNSAKVTLKRVELKAGKGLKGKDGVAGGVTDDAAAAGAEQNGKPAVCGGTPANADGGIWGAAVCGSRGGDGGKAVLDTAGGDGFSGTPSANVEPPSAVNKGLGSNVGGADATPGTKGSKGSAGPLGAAASPLGVVAAAGYTPADGNAGASGFPGQGGGGGGASKGSATCRGASGGAGGLGGCGGKPGGAGHGGGASIGLFSWTSQVNLDGCAISSATGGDGGAGGAGGGGGGGGSGGLAGQGNQVNAIGLSGQGGQGGPGGNGGSGSGGSGGPSYGIVFSGTKPLYTEPDTTLTAGKGGAAGVGGKVLTAKAPDGAIGASAPELDLK